MSEYAEYVREVLEPFGAIRVRRMFGGYGVYHEGLMFGLIADDVLYLKADDQSARSFEDRELARFQYLRNGKATKMSYFAAPEEIFEDAEEARLWASRAYEAALRSRNRASKTKQAGHLCFPNEIVQVSKSNSLPGFLPFSAHGPRNPSSGPPEVRRRSR